MKIDLDYVRRIWAIGGMAKPVIMAVWRDPISPSRTIMLAEGSVHDPKITPALLWRGVAILDDVFEAIAPAVIGIDDKLYAASYRSEAAQDLRAMNGIGHPIPFELLGIIEG